MFIETENLTFSFGGKIKDLSLRALDNVTLRIDEGDFFGIIGHTGSGKSTLVQHFNGIIKTDGKHGKIRVGEFDLTDKKCDFKGLRRKVGLVFQYPEYQLFAETVKDEVAFGIKNFFPEKSAEEVESMVKDAIEKVGLNYDRVKEKSPFDMSGGQKRRVAIAGVIASRPEVLVLDEPVAGLDPKGKKELTNLLHRLHETTVKTVVVVSHDMDFISENCNRAAVMEKGRIKKVGTPEEIFSEEGIMDEKYLPITAYLTRKLKEIGVEVKSDLTSDGFCKAVAEAFGKGGEK